MLRISSPTTQRSNILTSVQAKLTFTVTVDFETVSDYLPGPFQRMLQAWCPVAGTHRQWGHRACVLGVKTCVCGAQKVKRKKGETTEGSCWTRGCMMSLCLGFTSNLL